jgi:hypothetical protein
LKSALYDAKGTLGELLKIIRTLSGGICAGSVDFGRTSLEKFRNQKYWSIIEHMSPNVDVISNVQVFGTWSYCSRTAQVVSTVSAFAGFFHHSRKAMGVNIEVMIETKTIAVKTVSDKTSVPASRHWYAMINAISARGIIRIPSSMASLRFTTRNAGRKTPKNCAVSC